MSKLGDKTAFRESNANTWRERPPTSPEIAERGNVRMSIDFTRQNAVVPRHLGQTTRYGENDAQFRTMNADGKPFALDTMNGAGPDTRSRGFGTGGGTSPVKGK